VRKHPSLGDLFYFFLLLYCLRNVSIGSPVDPLSLLTSWKKTAWQGEEQSSIVFTSITFTDSLLLWNTLPFRVILEAGEGFDFGNGDGNDFAFQINSI